MFTAIIDAAGSLPYTRVMALSTRRSKQRTRILELLENERVHVTANWVYDQLREEFPTLSLGNVYRNLNILVEQGAINRLPFGSTFDVYEACREPHYHFICDLCGTIEDVPVPPALQRKLTEAVHTATPHRVSHTTVEFHGTCETCRDRR